MGAGEKSRERNGKYGKSATGIVLYQIHDQFANKNSSCRIRQRPAVDPATCDDDEKKRCPEAMSARAVIGMRAALFTRMLSNSARH